MRAVLLAFNPALASRLAGRSGKFTQGLDHRSNGMIAMTARRHRSHSIVTVTQVRGSLPHEVRGLDAAADSRLEIRPAEDQRVRALFVVEPVRARSRHEAPVHPRAQRRTDGYRRQNEFARLTGNHV